MQSRSFSAAALCAVLLLVISTTAGAAIITVDDFDNPNPIGSGDIFFIAGVPPTFGNPNPTLITQGVSGAIGGWRHTYVEVKGTPSPISVSGIIGDGDYQFSSFGTPGTTTSLIYDGGPSPMQLGGLDLTSGGANGMLRLSFISVDGGDASTMKIAVLAGGTGGSSSFVGSIPESSTAFTYDIPFAAFSDPSQLASLKTLTVTFNDAVSPVPDVSFSLDSIVAVPIPEPATLGLLALPAAFFLSRRRTH